jgi:hypothetical protein
MADETKGPEGWESEDFEREKVRELREQGLDPGSAQMKLKAIGHPSARSMGAQEPGADEGGVEQPVSGPAEDDGES